MSEDTPYPWPLAGDELFSSDGHWSRRAVLPPFSASWSVYAEGYKRAGGEVARGLSVPPGARRGPQHPLPAVAGWAGFGCPPSPAHLARSLCGPRARSAWRAPPEAEFCRRGDGVADVQS